MKSSITSNVDLNLTPQERAAKAKDERNDGLIQDAVEEARRTGPKPREIGESGKLLVTYDQLADTQSYATGDRKFIQPIGYRVGPQFPGGFEWVLTDADKGAVEAGYACQRCLDYYPPVWTPACSTCWLERPTN